MFSLIYDEQEAIRVAKEEAREEAKEETTEIILKIAHAYREGKPLTEIAAQHEMKDDEVEKIIFEIYPKQEQQASDKAAEPASAAYALQDRKPATGK